MNPIGTSDENVTLFNALEVIVEDAEGIEWTVSVSISAENRAYSVDGSEPSRSLVDLFRSQPRFKFLQFLESSDSKGV
jgi:hypothetical protein